MTSPEEWTLQSLSLRWKQGDLQILDQRLLPQTEQWLAIEGIEDMVSAIQALKVRGAPLIGVAAALALAEEGHRLMAQQEGGARQDFLSALASARRSLADSRPTAVNLMWALDRLWQRVETENNTAPGADEPPGSSDATFLGMEKISVALTEEARAIFAEDVQLCERIAKQGASLIEDGEGILTHCNTGGLATAGVGTALGVIRKAHEQGKKIHVYVDETRPLLQGGRLTTWELSCLGIPHTLICDSMAASLMAQGKVQKVIVGADRIAQNGDFANKVGTYSLAVLCFYHRIPLLVAAPWSTVDLNCRTGAEIPVEQRQAEEVWGLSGAQNSPVYNPAFDVTPHELVQHWILDRGVYSQQEVAGALKKEF